MTQMTAMQARTTVGWHVEMEFQEDDHRTRAAALDRARPALRGGRDASLGRLTALRDLVAEKCEASAPSGRYLVADMGKRDDVEKLAKSDPRFWK